MSFYQKRETSTTSMYQVPTIPHTSIYEKPLNELYSDYQSCENQETISKLSELEIQTIKDKIWRITQELYNDESNGFLQVFYRFNDYLSNINNKIVHYDSNFRTYCAYFKQFINMKSSERMDQLKMNLQSTTDLKILYKLDAIIKSIKDFNYNANDKSLQIFQLTYFYNKIFSKISADFDKYDNEVQLYNSHINKLDSNEQRCFRSQNLNKHSFKWYTHLEFSTNMAYETYIHMEEFIGYFMPRLNTESVENVKCNKTNNKTKKRARKKKIPAALRNAVWNECNGTESKVGSCYVCKEMITFSSFHSGHVLAEANGGDITLDNLKPICGLCNSSMGKMNMEDFIKKYGFDKIKPKDKTLFELNKHTPIEIIMNKLDKKDKKTISSILYKNKLCNLSEML